MVRKTTGTARQRPLIIAHRGVGRGRDRNTLAAFRRAITAGADMIEFDVRRAADGLVVFHDPWIHGRRVGGLTREELSRRAGVEVPSLRSVLELARGKIGADIELKEDGYGEEVLQLVRQYCDPRTTIISSFLDSVMSTSRRVAPEFRTGLMLGNPNPLTSPASRWSELFPAARLETVGATFSEPFQGYARLGAVTRAAEANRRSLVWMVNGRHGLRRWLADPNVYAIITDRVELALRLAAAT